LITLIDEGLDTFNIKDYLDHHLVFGLDNENIPITLFFKKEFQDFKLDPKIERRKYLVLKDTHGKDKDKKFTSDKLFNEISFNYWDSIKILEHDLNTVNIFINSINEKKEQEAKRIEAAKKEQEAKRIEAAKKEQEAKRIEAAEKNQAFCRQIPGLFEIYNDTAHSETSKERLVDNVKQLKEMRHITLKDIREICRLSDDAIRMQLENGRKTIDTLEQCEQYWYTYSKFIGQQWDYFFNEHEKIITDACTKPIKIIDYACGQGFATINFLDKFFINKMSILDITLIEKSSLTLLLAKIFLSIHSPGIGLSRVKSINKEVDNIPTDYFESDPKAVTIHLFSNILDMGVIDSDKLLSKINKIKGKHLFLFVSQGADKDSRNKFDDFIECLWLSKYKFKAIETRIPAEQFTIQATKEMNVISSIASMEVIE